MEKRTDIFQVDGSMVYRLRRAGFRKGVEQFENSVMFQVYVCPRAIKEDGERTSEEFARDVADLLNMDFG